MGYGMTPGNSYDIRRFVEHYRISKLDAKQEEYYNHSSHPLWYGKNAYDYKMQQEFRIKYTMELDEHSLLDIINRMKQFDEYNDMMRDPETAKLVMEAKFIYRLKGRF
jgi:hypothetical protein